MHASRSARKHSGRKRSVFPVICMIVTGMVLLFIGSAIFAIVAGGISHFGQALSSEEVLFSLRMSMATSSISTVICLLLALPTAYVFSHVSFPGKRVAEVIMELTLSLPYILLGFALLLIFGMIFALGWWRDLPMEYLPARRLGSWGVNQYAQKVRARAQGKMAHNMLGNMLLSLPAMIGALAVIVPYILDHIRITGNKLMLLQGILRVIKSPLPGMQIILLALVFLLLYLPCCALRKMRNAVLVRRLSRELNDQGDGRAVG